MYAQSNATRPLAITQSNGPAPYAALALSALGVLGFSGTLPATRIAAERLDPLVLGPGRSVLAALLGAVYLLVCRGPLPAPRQLGVLALVGLGTSSAYPLFSTLALREVSAQHAVVMVGLTPLATSVAAVVLHRERTDALFWLYALAGAGAVLAFGVHAHGLALHRADLWLLLAVLSVGTSYAEAGRLARTLGGVRVLCWSLVLALPVTGPALLSGLAGGRLARADLASASAFLYLSLVSMLLAFCAWYRGLALGGVARSSQVQLLQPILSLVWCGLLLDEPLTWASLLTGISVLLCALGARRARA